jgi:HSP20 family molecular chaperone IbpA
MFGLMRGKRAAKKTVGGQGAALTPPGFPLLRNALFPAVDRLFDHFLRDWELPVMGRKAWRWRVEVEEKDDEIVVRTVAPGFEPADFEVEVRDELLVIHAVKEKKLERKDKEERAKYVRQAFYKFMPLPGPVSVERAAARYVDGVLIVTLPKVGEAKGRACGLPRLRRDPFVPVR